MRTAMAQISLRIRAYWSGTLTARLQNQWILQNVWMESKCPWYFAHAQEDLNLRILRMLDGTFLLDTAHILCEQQAFQSSHLALYIFMIDTWATLGITKVIDLHFCSKRII